jgi:serine/threonine-protein kinase
VQFIPTLPKAGDIVGRKYRIAASIGAGGMGVVYEALHVDTEGPVALKWLNPELSSSAEAVERFKIEARAMGRIHHPNVVAVHDLGEHEGSLYLVMELLKGGSLRKRMEQGRMSLAECLQVLFPVMRGVAAAHSVKVLHRDLKPDNIFLAESPDGLEAAPKVLDFGIAKLCSDSERTSAVSAKTTMMGTYQYMPFEQLHGRKDLDDRVDVYALGCVLYSMLSGRLPYQADNPVDLALQMLQADPKPVTVHQSGLPSGLSQVIAKALARDRAERFASVDQFALALEPFAQGLRYRGMAPRGAVDAPLAGGPARIDSPLAQWPMADHGYATAPLPTPFAVVESQAVDPAQVKTAPGRPSRAPRRSRAPYWLAAAGAAALLAALGGKWLSSGANHGAPPPAPPAAPQAEANATGMPALPASALPLAHPDAGPSHVEEWANPVVSAEVTDPAEPSVASRAGTNPTAPTPGVEPALQPAPNAGKPSAASRRPRASSDEHADAGAGVAAKPTASDPLALPPPTVRRGALPQTQPLDMTELPAPAWAKPPSAKRSGH